MVFKSPILAPDMSLKVKEKYLKLLEGDRFLLMHHRGASRYYKINGCFLLFFLGLSVINYYRDQSIFFNKTGGKLYIGLLASGVLFLFLFGNRQIKNLYLDMSGKNVIIDTHTMLGFAQGREKVIPVNSLKGRRLFWSPKMNLY